jgi:hypothetical protein
VARLLGLPLDAILPYRLLLVGAGAQALGLLGLIVLYYFDLRGEALVAAAGLLLAIAACTTLAVLAGLLPSAGTVVGCCVGAALIWRGVFAGVRAVLTHTLLGQPYVVDDDSENVSRATNAKARRRSRRTSPVAGSRRPHVAPTRLVSRQGVTPPGPSRPAPG